ncbi:hypothetical protein [Teredinibacter sp. KSP-S5-2]|uniref:hypothetical protein n=1 Tax=Teredinibacter sp. KSP-S5-2 TaxID=3034506 RepID=UPI00293489A0|nr:hypothetical protein [Teredinibacter sp. KSP-S5-2]WNO11138.1 hypothetical protein P5V12_08130 [Teredinibacter sp. KSP-S5-2]
MSRVLLAIVLVCFSMFSFGQNHNIDEYIDIVKNGSWAEKVVVYKKLYEFSGVTDERLFDEIQKQVEKSIGVALVTKPEQEEFHWGIKSLASSGNPKYLTVLNRIASTTNSNKTKRHAVLASRRLPEFSQWNPVINSKEYESPNRTKDEALWMRYIHNGDFEMATMAVSQAYKNLKFDDREFVNVVKTKLTDMYLHKTNEKYAVQFQSWVCKYLMLDIEAEKHRPLVVSVANKSPNPAVQRWAKKVLK